jgi:YD repeat-containing protein
MNGLRSQFTYDTLDRLKALTASKAGTTAVGYNYTLAATGHRMSVTEANNRNVTWSYDGIYRLTNETISSDPHGKNGAVAYGLDPVGNLKSVNGGAITYQYDGRGRLTAKTAGGVTTRYLIDDLNPTRLPQVVEEVVNGTVQRTYTHGLQEDQREPVDRVCVDSTRMEAS